MSTKKRIDHNSLGGAVEAFSNALEKLEPPAHVLLRDSDWPFWYAITGARAANSWNDSDLAKAGNLARCQSDIERLSVELMDEGDIIVNDRGTPIVNPKHSLLETLSRREVALSRVLHVHTEATVGRSRDSGNRAKAQKSTRETLGKVQGGGLIPGVEH